MSTATTHIKTEKILVPELRFNEFDGEWNKKKIREIIGKNVTIICVKPKMHKIKEV